MGYMTDGITFNGLREANVARLPEFKNGRGETAHEKADGSDWSLNDWYTAVMGEAGELGNLLKKVRRGDYTLNEAKSEISDEIADVVIYLDLLAKQLDLNLGQAVASKFNRKSKQVASTVRLGPEGIYRYL